MDSGLEGSSEVMAAHELENSWCILNHDEGLNELCEQVNPKSYSDDDEVRSISSASSDIEIIAETSSSSDAESQSLSNAAVDSLSASPSYATLETSEFLLNPEEEIDLNPGIKVYRKPYTPNTKVNYLLNISLLVALAAVTGLGIGNYITNRGLISREKEQVILKSRLDTCFPTNRTRTPLTVSASTRSLIATSEAITAISTSTTPSTSGSHQQMQVFIPLEPVKHTNRYLEYEDISPPKIVETVDLQLCQELNKNLVIETIASFDFMDKYSRKLQKKNKSAKIVPKKLYVWLLITDRGTSRPVFFVDNPRKDELTIISKLFVSAHFGKDKSVLWLHGCPQCLSFSRKLASDQLDVVTNSDNYWYNRQEKLMKHFWSKVKYSLYSSSKLDNGKDLKDKIYDAILSLSEEEYLSMFAKLRSKIRKLQAKDSLCGDSV